MVPTGQPPPGSWGDRTGWPVPTQRPLLRASWDARHIAGWKSGQVMGSDILYKHTVLLDARFGKRKMTSSTRVGSKPDQPTRKGRAMTPHTQQFANGQQEIFNVLNSIKRHCQEIEQDNYLIRRRMDLIVGMMIGGCVALPFIALASYLLLL
jgi:hypothetical protein